MKPHSKKDEYTRYCISPEAKEYLRQMLEERNDPVEDLSDDLKEFELSMDEEIDFENLRILDKEEDDEDLFDRFFEEQK